MVRIWRFHCRGPGLVPGWELRSHKPCGTAKKKKIKIKTLKKKRYKRGSKLYLKKKKRQEM